MSNLSIMTWNESTKTTKRKVSNATTFDFQAVNIGADVLPITQSGSGGSAKFDFGGKIMGNAAAPLAATDLGTKGYIDSAIATAVVTGGSVKESILLDSQLSDSNGIAAAGIFYLTAVAAEGDTFILKDATHTETFTFAAAADVFAPATGITAAASMTSLAARINTDSVYWSAAWAPSAFAEVNAGGCVVIYEKTTAAGASVSRFYGVFATAASAKVVPFNTLSEYNVSAAALLASTLSATDPAATSFGFRRTLASLISGEIHYSQEKDILWSWNAAAPAWNTLAAGAIPVATSGAGGGIQGKLTADTNYGLSIAAGVLKISTDISLTFAGGSLSVALSGGTLDKASGLKVASGGITATEINTSALGHGLTGGSGTTISAVASDGISVSASGIAVNYSSSMTNDNAGAITVGQVVYEVSAGHVDLAGAAVSGLYGKNVFVVTAASIAAAAPGLVAVRDGAVISGYTGLAVGPVYVSKAVLGGLTQDVSAYTTGDCVFQVGRAISATEIVFEPEAIIEY